MKLRPLLGSLYRGVASRFGTRALERMIGDGLPPRLHEPLRFLFSRRPPAAAHAAAERIERVRVELTARSDVFRFEHAPDSVVTARKIAESVSVQQRWGTFLLLCADAGDGGTILELGACCGSPARIWRLRAPRRKW
jgi:hypothetical protein